LKNHNSKIGFVRIEEIIDKSEIRAKNIDDDVENIV